MLESLELSGFKSFAKKTELDFKSKITAIVGPNGSGKSNIAEAFRFVLGEQSIKSMRGKRGEDLIWNGSQEIARANRAGVKLIFDNSKNLFGLDFEKVTIERIVNRDGTNEYFLNGSQIRLKDIIEILSQANIGASGYHIISQGEADRILSASMKERKEMIEDALGLKIYQYKREESEKKLLKTEENMKQVESLRREIAPHIRFLKKQVEKVEKAEELHKKLTRFYREYLKREKIYLEDFKKEIEIEKEPALKKLKGLEKEMDEAKNILSASGNKDGKSDELLEIENRIKKEREEKDRLYREIGKIEGEINANLRNIDKIRAEQKSEETKTIPLKEVEELEKEVSAFQEIYKILDAIRSFISRHKSSFSTKDIDDLFHANQRLEEKKTRHEEDVRKSETNLFELDKKLEQIKESIEKEKNTERDAEKNIFRISSEQSELRNKLEFLKEKEHRYSIEENDWKREIQEAGVLLGTAILGWENEAITEELAGKILSEKSSDLLAPLGQTFPQELSSQLEPREKQLERRRELEKMKIRLEELGGAGGEEVTKEYRETLERDEYLQKELEDLKKSAESLRGLISELLERIDHEFKQGIEKINEKFQEFFVIMFGGGSACLKITKLKIKNLPPDAFDSGKLLEQETENIETGIDIDVSLPRKRIRGLDMLSGGERALTSIALLFAVSQVKPPPFIILDETDAALDEANSKKYGDMIESLSKVSQLILITHNRETMSRAGVIYGITMGKDSVSRLLSIAFDEAIAVAK